MTTPRLRVFAGPNGSSKSTLAQWLARDYAVDRHCHRHIARAAVLLSD